MKYYRAFELKLFEERRLLNSKTVHPFYLLICSLFVANFVTLCGKNMQNILRKQTSKGEMPIGDKMELRELKDRLMKENGRQSLYGTSNSAFQSNDNPILYKVND